MQVAGLHVGGRLSAGRSSSSHGGSPLNSESHPVLSSGADTFVRFGGQKAFSREDLMGLKSTTQSAPVLMAFQKRFPPGSKVLASPANEAPVLVSTVVSNDGHQMEIQWTEDTPPAFLSLEENLFLFQQTLAMNLPLINDKTLTPELQWRALFEKHIDRVQTKLDSRQGQPIPLHKVSHPDNIAHPCGFNIFGNLYMMPHPEFHPDELPGYLPLQGSEQDPLEMVRHIVDRHDLEQAEAQTDGNSKAALRNLVNDRTCVVNPEQLVPLICDGMYERAAFLMLGTRDDS